MTELETNHTKYMKLAIQIAREGIADGQTPFGACIVSGNNVVSTAHNTVWREVDITAHAEVNAIRLACKALNRVDLSDCVIYSTCEPCPMCFSAIHWARIPQVYHGASIEDAKHYGFNEIPLSNHQLIHMGSLTGMTVVPDVLHSECISLFAEWEQSGLNNPY